MLVELLQRTLTGDSAACQEFVARTEDYIRKRLRFYGSDIPPDDLPDLTNEVYARLFPYCRSSAFAPVCDGQIFACLGTIAWRVVCDYHRKRKRREAAEAGFMAAQQTGEPCRKLENQLDWEKLAGDETQRQMIELRANGKTYREIAEALGLKFHRVTAFFYRLRKKNKKC